MASYKSTCWDKNSAWNPTQPENEDPTNLAHPLPPSGDGSGEDERREVVGCRKGKTKISALNLELLLIRDI